MASPSKTPTAPVLSSWCRPDVVDRLPSDAHRTAHHERCQALAERGALPRECPCPCHHPEETPVPEIIPNPDGTVSTIDLSSSVIAAGSVQLSKDGWVGLTEGTPEGAVGLLTQLVKTLDESLLGYHPGDWTDAVRLLASLRGPIETLRRIDSDLSRWLYVHAEHGDHEVDDVGVVKIIRTRDRRNWDDRAVVGAIIDQRMTDLSGEIPNDPWAIADWILEAAGIGYWRTGALKALGLEPKAFCDDSPGKPQVTTPR